MTLDWEQVASDIDQLILNSDKTFAAPTIANAKAFVSAATLRYRTPDDIGEGYWPVISFHWKHPTYDWIEVETHEESFELYRIEQGRPGITEHYLSSPGETPPDLLDTLDGLLR